MKNGLNHNYYINMQILVPVVEEALHVVIAVERGGGRILMVHIQEASTINKYKHTPGGKDCEYAQITSRKYRIAGKFGEH